MPPTINTDQAAAYGAAIKELKQEGKCPNNTVEADHGKLKRLIKPTLGFNSLKTAYATIKGFELMHMFKKVQLKFWQRDQGIAGQIRLISQCLVAY